MNPIRILPRPARILAAGAWALLVLAIASPAMAATASLPHYGPAVAPPHVPARIHAVTGGMPGWQITLIAIAAALAAATLAVLVDRAVSSRRRVIPTAA